MACCIGYEVQDLYRVEMQAYDNRSFLGRVVSCELVLSTNYCYFIHSSQQ